MNSIKKFNNREKITEMIELCVDYNSLDIYTKIEKIVYHKIKKK